MRAVLDTNVLVSVAIASGPPYRIVDEWFERAHFELILCPSLLEELEDVLVNREGMRPWITAEAGRLYVTRLSTTADIRPDPSPGRALTRDPDDDYLIYLARENGADAIVSGDSDLLDWPEQDPPIVMPATFERLLIPGVRAADSLRVTQRWRTQQRSSRVDLAYVSVLRHPESARYRLFKLGFFSSPQAIGLAVA